jgi:hypothetical protein
MLTLILFLHGVTARCQAGAMNAANVPHWVKAWR